VSSVESQPRFGGTCLCDLQGRRIIQEKKQHEVGMKQIPASRWSYLAYSSTLTMAPTCSSETSVDFQGTIWRYVPQRILRTLFCRKHSCTSASTKRWQNRYPSRFRHIRSNSFIRSHQIACRLQYGSRRWNGSKVEGILIIFTQNLHVVLD
jgi:hypothetical protein